MSSPPNDSLMAPIPRKKRASVASAAVASNQSESSTADVDFGTIPRKSSSLKRQPSSSLPKERELENRSDQPSKKKERSRRSALVQITSESPFLLRIKVNLDAFQREQQQLQQQRTSQRQPKRSRPIYQEVELTDSDDFMTDDDQAGPLKKKGRLVPYSAIGKSNLKSNPGGGSTAASGAEDALEGPNPALESLPLSSTMLVDPDNMSPPEGTLSTLWYSREVFGQIFVLEKIVGFKSRPVVRLMQSKTVPAAAAMATPTAVEGAPVAAPHPASTQPTTEPYVLDATTASHLQQALLQNEAFWPSVQNRMELSRLVPHRCPAVLVAAALREEELAKREGRAPVFFLSPPNAEEEQQHEEVLLIKWRGRSHMHCSWERAVDLYHTDTSNNSTARNKVKRYYQTKETELGPEWKKAIKAQESSSEVDIAETEEYFARQCLELERILACDENEMNLDVLAKQRGRNMQIEQEALQRREAVLPGGSSPLHESAAASHSTPSTSDFVPAVYEPLKKLLLEHPDVLDALLKSIGDLPWDEEDNVRYVVKWKGLPYAELTWEYWRDIKLDAVALAEDYWYRQKAPTIVNKPHPHVRDFRKLQKSPAFGLSSRDRPVIGFEDNEKEEGDALEGFKLRAYQLEGVNWLLFNWWNNRSCILADEMGLGKTIQSTAFLRELQTNDSTQIRGPFLIVAPLSLAGQWQSELASWAPDMNVILYHGSADARSFIVQQEFYYNEPFVNKSTASKYKKQGVTKFHVLITTYEVVLKDSAVLSKIRWRVLIVDEAHRLKNHKSRLFEDLSAVPREHCVLLTGTPIANATEELWALLHFCNPKSFDKRDEFLLKFGEMTDAKQVNELHALLRPYLLRRVKEDVEKSLPPKEETILEVSLTPIQKTFYKAIYERNTTFLFKGATSRNTPSLMNVMMELRKCCNHPFLIKGAEERILADAATKLKEKTAEESAPIDYLTLFGEQLIKSSGKMVLIEKLLTKLFTGGHKVLIFSQMVKVLDLLEELLKLKRYRYERLDGSTSSSSRAASVERFIRKSCQRFVMLLSTRAGGLGLNLTAADVVIIFDSDWNPQNDLQAMARAHRIGQEKRVMIYRLLTQKTYEMHMFHSASLKLGLERAVMSQNRDQGDDSDDKSKKKSDRDAQAKEIDELLKKGAYDVFRDEDNAEAEKFMEADIDQLLADSSKKVTYGPSATSSLGSGLGSFSKASFVADTDDGAKDVDLDDPEFWSKAVGLEAPVETPEELQILAKRNRKQVQVYDPYAETAEVAQKKKEKIALEKQLEKEEKERQRLEKKAKKEAAKEKKKREKEEKTKDKASSDASAVAKVVVKDDQPKKPQADSKPPKKSKKNDRQRALRRLENENPALEQLKQAWEVSQRQRATAAILRFGNFRFCKLRHESNLTSLPLQDLENFTRSYLYQIALQAGSALLHILREGGKVGEVRFMIKEWLGASFSLSELEFIFDSIATVIQCHEEVEAYRRFLRVPAILAEPVYVADLRRGAAFRALRRVGVNARLNNFIEQIMDDILATLGHEELGKRGSFGDLTCYDLDLKARFVTVEELTLAVGTSFQRVVGLTPPAIWWDRECDVGLLLGTFIHGVGNYKSIGADADLCFSKKIKTVSDGYAACKAGVENFTIASKAARKVFDDALEAGRVKAELEVQAAVAAAAKAAKEREEDAAMLREGGENAEAQAKHTPDTLVEKAFEFDGTDSHFVTLPRMHKFVRSSLESDEGSTAAASDEEDAEMPDESTGKGRGRERVPMPDARVLDYRLLLLLREIEQTDQSGNEWEVEGNYWPKSNDVIATTEARNEVFGAYVGESVDQWVEEFTGVGIGSYQCGTTHRTLNDGSSYGHGSGTASLAQVAYGTDAPRYLRQIGVPMNLTRYAVCALVHADSACVEEMLRGENLKFYGNEKGKKDPNNMDGKAADEPANANATSPSAAPSAGTGAASAPAPKPAQDSTKKTYNDEKLLRIREEFRDNPKLRGLVCMAVLLHGYPPQQRTGSVHPDLLSQMDINQDTMQTALFDRQAFHEAVTSLAVDGVQVPEEPILSEYIDKHLIPHCFQLCLYGNGPTTRDARGSQGEYETAMGISLHPEPSSPHPLPIPDPCLPIQEHSLEAVCHASAILRRVQLLKACQYVASCCECSAEQVIAHARSKPMCDLQEFPSYWCPWLHDVALVVEAAARGLFSVIPTRNEHPVFAPERVEDFLRTSLATNGTVLPGSNHSSTAKIDDWLKQEADRFLGMNQIERRLSFLCDLVTAEASDRANKYCNLPMFDHGGWPRL